MDKLELLNAIMAESGLAKADAEAALKAFAAVITKAIAAGETVQIYGLGSFAPKTKAAREGINPLTKQAFSSPESKTVGFKPSKILKDALN